MYQTWEEIKKQYPNQWVCLVDFGYQDAYEQALDGGVVRCADGTNKGLHKQMGIMDKEWAIHHTAEEDEDGQAFFNLKYGTQHDYFNRV